MSPDQSNSPAGTSRRRFLRGTAGAVAATGALAAGATPAAAQAFDGWFEDVPNYEGEIADMTGEDAVTVEVGVETGQGPYGFGPPAVRVDPGTEVTFTWVSNTHNVLPEEQPSGANWSGHEPIENDGFEFSSTFETEGVYLYYCNPHLSLGMKGAIVVGDAEVGGGGGGGGGGGEADDGGLLSPGLLTLGGALLLGALSPVVFGLYLLLRRDDSPPDGEERIADGHGAATAGGHGATAPEGVPVTEEAPESEPARELGHDEFDPVGTASLVAVYLAILVVMWVFMYFVEFLGRGPTVIG